MSVHGSGSPQARIMIVGEAPGENEVREGRPFVGPSGAELNKMLHEAGIARTECYVTNVCRTRPPDNKLEDWLSTNKKAPVGCPTWTCVDGLWLDPRVVEGLKCLEQEIDLVKPNVIIAFGNLAMWALTRKWAITKWRGSELGGNDGPVVIPTIHPASVLRAWDQRNLVVEDLKRAKKYEFSRTIKRANYSFIIRPLLADVLRVFDWMEMQLAQRTLELTCDLETRNGHIACLGLGWSKEHALCIPLMCVERNDGYWTEAEENVILPRLRSILTHPKVLVCNQNWLYDAQYFWRWLRFMPNWVFDTMAGHHTVFPGTAKDLGQLSSIYCEWHEYWKDDGKEWAARQDEDQLWRYNCVDCVRTFEIWQAQKPMAQQTGLEGPSVFQQSVAPWIALDIMIRGMAFDKKARGELSTVLLEEMTSREAYFQQVLGHPFNPNSPKQMQTLFYDDLRMPVQYKRRGKGPATVTTDEDALEKLGNKEPMLRPLIRRINEYRSLRVFRSTFVEATLDIDNRMRTSFNPYGTETFRGSSGTNAFWTGMNMQNIPKGDEEADDPNTLQLPNVRKLFIPDPGYVIADMDLDRADLQVVVWEADDEELRSALRAGVDLHSLNAKTLFHLSASVDSIKKFHPDKRDLAKRWVHGTNYGGGARTMAQSCGITVHEADRLRERWFQAHPGIAEWHKRTENSLRTTRSVANRFGYRRFYFDRVDGLLPEALAWVPQSTVAAVINRVWAEIVTTLPLVQVLNQVHDSLVLQWPASYPEMAQACIDCAKRVVVPYENPLVIPAGINVSSKSWGDCK